MYELAIDGLSKTFDGPDPVVAVDDFSLRVREGELLVLLGPSGCGKSTVLRCIAGLESPTDGAVRLSGEVVFDRRMKLDVPPEKRDIGMVFQNYALWPHMSVHANVAYPLKARTKLSNDEVLETTHRALAMVRCEDLAERYPSELSGGQQQRIALARGLVARPSVLLLDEPLSNLDALLRLDLREEIRKLHSRVGFTGVYVTHDQGEALSLGTRIAVMKAGSIVQIGTPQEVYRAPATPYVASFLGARNMSRLVRKEGGWSAEWGRLPAVEPFLPSNASECSVLIRPEALALGGPDDGQPRDGVLVATAEVETRSFIGSHYEYVLSADGKELHVSAASGEGRLSANVGDEVEVWAERKDVYVYCGERRVDIKTSPVIEGSTGTEDGVKGMYR